MSKLLRITLIVGALFLVVLILGFVGLWWSVKYQPAWYVEQVKIDTKSPQCREAGSEMEQGIAQVVSGFNKSDKWEVVFTEEQINSYLAATLPQKHPELIPSELHDPRVKIEADGITIAARIERPIETVISLKVDVYLSRENTIAVQISHARAGRLPWSLGRLTKEISAAARRSKTHLTWSRSGQDPVALITVVSSDPKKATEITACQLEDGKLYLAGITKKRSKDNNK